MLLSAVWIRTGRPQGERYVEQCIKKDKYPTNIYALSADEVPLNINHHDNPAVISVVNNPRFETSYSP